MALQAVPRVYDVCKADALVGAHALVFRSEQQQDMRRAPQGGQTLQTAEVLHSNDCFQPAKRVDVLEQRRTGR